MRQISRVLVVLASLCLTSITLAEEAGVKLSKEGLAAFIPGTKAVYVIKGGSTHRWTNEPDGRLTASTDAKSINMIGGIAHTASGTWHISDDGKYCIDISWKRYPESWCRYLFRAPDGEYYLTNEDVPDSERRPIDLTK